MVMAVSQLCHSPSVLSVGFLARQHRGKTSPRPMGPPAQRPSQEALGRRWRLPPAGLAPSGAGQAEGGLQEAMEGREAQRPDWDGAYTHHPSLQHLFKLAQAQARHLPPPHPPPPRCRPYPVVPPRHGPVPPRGPACQPSVLPPGACVPAAPAPPAS